MNLQKFTQKSLEAIQNAQSNAVEYGNPQLDQQHLLLALLQQEDGLIPGLLQKMNSLRIVTMFLSLASHLVCAYAVQC